MLLLPLGLWASYKLIPAQVRPYSVLQCLSLMLTLLLVGTAHTLVQHTPGKQQNDDMLLLPLGLWASYKLIPAQVRPYSLVDM
jgi:hypothetical protein